MNVSMNVTLPQDALDQIKVLALQHKRKLRDEVAYILAQEIERATAAPEPPIAYVDQNAAAWTPDKVERVLFLLAQIAKELETARLRK